MSEKNKQVQLNKAMTYVGVNYAPGINEMPAAAAASAIKRKLGKAAGEQAAADGEASGEFTPLSFEDTFRRFEEGDTASEVFESLKYYQPKMAEAKKAGMTISEFLKTENAAAGGGGLEVGKNAGLPEDFPMRHVYAKLGEEYDSVEKIQAKTREELIAIDGIAEASADKTLAYGK